MLSKEGRDWSREDNERLLGTTVVDSFRIIGEIHPLQQPIDAYIPIYDAAVVEILSRSLTPAEGVIDLIGDLAARGAPLAVASSSLRSWIDATLISLGIQDRFSVIVSGEEILAGKPAPDIYLETAERLGIPPQFCVAVEDAPNGVLSAKAAGMSVVAVRTPYTEHLPLGPVDLVVSNLAELEIQDGAEGSAFSSGAAIRR